MTNPEPLSREEREKLSRILERGGPVMLPDLIRYEATVRDMEAYILELETQVADCEKQRNRSWDALRKISHEEPAYEQGRECRGCQDMIDIAREATREQ